uniref:EF-hand domain-containing protein n=1 Tax=Chromera velia CCMP2878 TaxID=1169474 RepID=A0A0G4FPN0_9ALVE|eukprot:Cvel_3555.t1-p1 / transcript=Cvel_3555.t1 / gene=Cvel_3555 / organism=Chromera_velia_CCMP2878 / gene_product=Myosin-2 heavy chain, putative / transcript_product=Myosin-2 heavy chain, putative / location=Cvel_scaffold145:38256-64283(+) / protein_length=3809 / sequence_SO=supercontig / SO=protein_coding / is_pseudo=false
MSSRRPGGRRGGYDRDRERDRDDQYDRGGEDFESERPDDGESRYEDEEDDYKYEYEAMRKKYQDMKSLKLTLERKLETAQSELTHEKKRTAQLEDRLKKQEMKEKNLQDELDVAKSKTPALDGADEHSKGVIKSHLQEKDALLKQLEDLKEENAVFAEQVQVLEEDKAELIARCNYLEDKQAEEDALQEAAEDREAELRAQVQTLAATLEEKNLQVEAQSRFEQEYDSRVGAIVAEKDLEVADLKKKNALLLGRAKQLEEEVSVLRRLKGLQLNLGVGGSEEVTSVEQLAGILMDKSNEADALREELADFKRRFGLMLDEGGGPSGVWKEKLNETQGELKRAEDRLQRAQEAEKAKDADITRMAARMRQYEQQFGIEEAMRLVDELERDKSRLERETGELKRLQGDFLEEAQELVHENKLLRQMADVPADYGLDLSQMKIASQVLAQGAVARAKHLEREVLDLEEERVELRMKLRSMASLTAHKAVEAFADSLRRGVIKLPLDDRSVELKKQAEKELARHVDLKVQQVVEATERVTSLEEQNDALREENERMGSALQRLGDLLEDSNRKIQEGRDTQKQDMELVLHELSILHSSLKQGELARAQGGLALQRQGQAGPQQMALPAGAGAAVPRSQDALREYAMGRLLGGGGDGRRGIDVESFPPVPIPNLTGLSSAPTAYSFSLGRQIAVPFEVQEACGSLDTLYAQLVEAMEEIRRLQETNKYLKSDTEHLEGQFDKAVAQQEVLYTDYFKKKRQFEEELSEMREALRRAEEGRAVVAKERDLLRERLSFQYDSLKSEDERVRFELLERLAAAEGNESVLARKLEVERQEHRALQKANDSLEQEHAEVASFLQKRVGQLAAYKKRASNVIRGFHQRQRETVGKADHELLARQKDLQELRCAELLKRQTRLLSQRADIQASLLEMQEVRDANALLKLLQGETETEMTALRSRLENLDPDFRLQSQACRRVVRQLREAGIASYLAFERDLCEFAAMDSTGAAGGKISRDGLWAFFAKLRVVPDKRTRNLFMQSCSSPTSEKFLPLDAVLSRLRLFGLRVLSGEEEFFVRLLDSLRTRGMTPDDFVRTIFPSAPPESVVDCDEIERVLKNVLSPPLLKNEFAEVCGFLGMDPENRPEPERGDALPGGLAPLPEAGTSDPQAAGDSALQKAVKPSPSLMKRRKKKQARKRGRKEGAKPFQAPADLVLQLIREKLSAAAAAAPMDCGHGGGGAGSAEEDEEELTGAAEKRRERLRKHRQEMMGEEIKLALELNSVILKEGLSLQAALNLFDPDNDGIVTRLEFRKACVTLYPRCSSKRADLLFDLFVSGKDLEGDEERDQAAERQRELPDDIPPSEGLWKDALVERFGNFVKRQTSAVTIQQSFRRNRWKRRRRPGQTRDGAQTDGATEGGQTALALPGNAGGGVGGGATTSTEADIQLFMAEGREAAARRRLAVLEQKLQASQGTQRRLERQSEELEEDLARVSEDLLRERSRRVKAEHLLQTDYVEVRRVEEALIERDNLRRDHETLHDRVGHFRDLFRIAERQACALDLVARRRRDEARELSEGLTALQDLKSSNQELAQLGSMQRKLLVTQWHLTSVKSHASALRSGIQAMREDYRRLEETAERAEDDRDREARSVALRLAETEKENSNLKGKVVACVSVQRAEEMAMRMEEVAEKLSHTQAQLLKEREEKAKLQERAELDAKAREVRQDISEQLYRAFKETGADGMEKKFEDLGASLRDLKLSELRQRRAAEIERERVAALQQAAMEKERAIESLHEQLADWENKLEKQEGVWRTKLEEAQKMALRAQGFDPDGGGLAVFKGAAKARAQQQETLFEELRTSHKKAIRKISELEIQLKLAREDLKKATDRAAEREVAMEKLKRDILGGNARDVKNLDIFKQIRDEVGREADENVLAVSNAAMHSVEVLQKLLRDRDAEVKQAKKQQEAIVESARVSEEALREQLRASAEEALALRRDLAAHSAIDETDLRALAATALEPSQRDPQRGREGQRNGAGGRESIHPPPSPRSLVKRVRTRLAEKEAECETQRALIDRLGGALKEREEDLERASALFDEMEARLAAVREREKELEKKADEKNHQRLINKRVRELKDQVAEKDAELQRLTKAFNELIQELLKATEEEKKRERAKEQAEKEADRLAKAYAEQARELQSLKEEVRQLREASRRMKTGITPLARETAKQGGAEANEELQRARAVLVTSGEQIEELLRDRAVRDAEISRLTAAQKDFEDIRSELEAVKIRLERSERERAELEAMREKLEEAVANERVIRHLSQQIDDLQTGLATEKEKHKEAMEERSRLLSRLQQERSKVSRLEGLLSAFADEAERRQKDFVDAPMEVVQSLASRVECLETENDQLLREAQSARALLADPRARDARGSRGISEEAAKALGDSLRSLEEDNARLRERARRLEKMAAAGSGSGGGVQRGQQGGQAKGGDARAEGKAKEFLQGELEKERKEMKALEMENSFLKKTLEELQKGKVGAEDALKVLASKLDTLESQAERGSGPGKRDTAVSKRGAAGDEDTEVIRFLTAQLDEKDAQIKSLEEHKSLLESALKDEAAASAKLGPASSSSGDAAVRKKLESQVLALKGQKEQSQADTSQMVNTLADKVDELQKKLAETERELRAARAESGPPLSPELAGLLAPLRVAAEIRQEDLRGGVAVRSLVSELSTVQSANTKLQEEVARLRRDLEKEKRQRAADATSIQKKAKDGGEGGGSEELEALRLLTRQLDSDLDILKKENEILKGGIETWRARAQQKQHRRREGRARGAGRSRGGEVSSDDDDDGEVVASLLGALERLQKDKDRLERREERREAREAESEETLRLKVERLEKKNRFLEDSISRKEEGEKGAVGLLCQQVERLERQLAEERRGARDSADPQERKAMRSLTVQLESASRANEELRALIRSLTEGEREGELDAAPGTRANATALRILTGQLEDVTAQLQAARRELDTLHAAAGGAVSGDGGGAGVMERLKALEADRKELLVLRPKTEDLQKELRAAKLELESLRGARIVSSSSPGAQKEEGGSGGDQKNVSLLISKVDELSGSLAVSSNENAALKKANRELRETAEGLKARVAALENEIDRIRRDAQLAQARAASPRDSSAEARVSPSGSLMAVQNVHLREKVQTLQAAMDEATRRAAASAPYPSAQRQRQRDRPDSSAPASPSLSPSRDRDLRGVEARLRQAEEENAALRQELRTRQQASALNPTAEGQVGAVAATPGAPVVSDRGRMGTGAAAPSGPDRRPPSPSHAPALSADAAQKQRRLEESLATSRAEVARLRTQLEAARTEAAKLKTRPRTAAVRGGGASGAPSAPPHSRVRPYSSVSSPGRREAEAAQERERGAAGDSKPAEGRMLVAGAAGPAGVELSRVANSLVKEDEVRRRLYELENENDGLRRHAEVETERRVQTERARSEGLQNELLEERRLRAEAERNLREEREAGLGGRESSMALKVERYCSTLQGQIARQGESLETLRRELQQETEEKLRLEQANLEILFDKETAEARSSRLERRMTELDALSQALKAKLLTQSHTAVAGVGGGVSGPSGIPPPVLKSGRERELEAVVDGLRRASEKLQSENSKLQAEVGRLRCRPAASSVASRKAKAAPQGRGGGGDVPEEPSSSAAASGGADVSVLRREILNLRAELESVRAGERKEDESLVIGLREEVRRLSEENDAMRARQKEDREALEDADKVLQEVEKVEARYREIVNEHRGLRRALGLGQGQDALNAAENMRAGNELWDTARVVLGEVRDFLASRDLRASGVPVPQQLVKDIQSLTD